jgi:hypothetical protein
VSVIEEKLLSGAELGSEKKFDTSKYKKAAPELKSKYFVSNGFESASKSRNRAKAGEKRSKTGVNIEQEVTQTSSKYTPTPGRTQHYRS